MSTKQQPINRLPLGKIELFSLKYFGCCGLGGAISCGFTHSFVTPLDMVKCNMQSNPSYFPGVLSGYKRLMKGELTAHGYGKGPRALLRGFFPTFWGYWFQGLGKFGLYEVFNHYYSNLLSTDSAFRYRDIIRFAASASAEFFADIFLCPFEAIKVRVQTRPKFARGLIDGGTKIIRKEGFKNLYATITPLWCRQIPYTVIKFVSFERIAEWIFGILPRPKNQLTKNEQMGVILTSGYLAGILCGIFGHFSFDLPKSSHHYHRIASHPPDTMVSEINKLKMSGSIWTKVRDVYKGYTNTLDGTKVPGIGFAGLWKGFFLRCFMIGTLTGYHFHIINLLFKGFQWFIYGGWKIYLGLPSPGLDKKDHK